MSQDSRFTGLKKLPQTPAAELLARAKAKLIERVEAPADASVATVLEELDAKHAIFDMLLLLSHALPQREAVWWACLAARDLIPAGAPVPAHVEAVEAWVFKPDDERRAKVEETLREAEPMDDTTPCGLAAIYAKGTMGTGPMEDIPCRPGMFGVMVYKMVLTSFSEAVEGDEDGRAQLLIDRGLDIARGGSGRVERMAEPA